MVGEFYNSNQQSPKTSTRLGNKTAPILMDELALLKVFDRANAAETGLLEIREVALVEGLARPETPLAEKPLTTGDEHEKNNCYTRLFADCAPGVRPAEFDG